MSRCRDTTCRGTGAKATQSLREKLFSFPITRATIRRCRRIREPLSWPTARSRWHPCKARMTTPNRLTYGMRRAREWRIRATTLRSSRSTITWSQVMNNRLIAFKWRQRWSSRAMPREREWCSTRRSSRARSSRKEKYKRYPTRTMLSLPIRSISRWHLWSIKTLKSASRAIINTDSHSCWVQSRWCHRRSWHAILNTEWSRATPCSSISSTPFRQYCRTTGTPRALTWRTSRITSCRRRTTTIRTSGTIMFIWIIRIRIMCSIRKCRRLTLIRTVIRSRLWIGSMSLRMRIRARRRSRIWESHRQIYSARSKACCRQASPFRLLMERSRSKRRATVSSNRMWPVRPRRRKGHFLGYLAASRSRTLIETKQNTLMPTTNPYVK